MADKEVMIYIELYEGGLHASARELATLARRLADELGGVASAILLGSGVADLATDLIAQGIDKVYVADDPQFQNYQAEAHTAAVEQVCRDADPEILLISHTLYGRDLAPRLALRLKTAVTTDCVEFKVVPDSKRLLVTRPVYGAKAMADFAIGGRPQLVTVRRKVVSPAEKDEARTGQTIPVEIKIDPAQLRVKYVERVKEEAVGPKLEDAEVVISGGRGIGSAENFKRLEELAKILGGAVGASRAAVDNGWVPSTQQVGLSGVMVAPRLYIAIGISGSSQHLAGCASSQYIVGINTDPDAPIFTRARYGIVADYKQVLPTIVQLLSEG